MKAKPFIKWIGGKQRLAGEIIKRFGILTDETVYHEPFVGGGGVFLELRNRGFRGYAVLGDYNLPLMNAWYWIKVAPEPVIELLREHAKNDSAEHYETTRRFLRKHQDTQMVSSIGGFQDTPDLAAAFIYLNKTCYNGLYRENQQGLFNAAYGKTADGKPPKICDEETITRLHDAMGWSQLYCQHIKNSRIKGRDDLQNSVIYLDPPYHNTYTGYTAHGFTEEDQQLLCQQAFLWRGLGARVVISNSDTEFIRGLYGSKGAKIEVLKVARSVNRDVEGRKPTGELLITL